MDLRVNESFELVINDKNDLSTVKDGEELKQRLFTAITLFQRNVIGDLNDPNALRKVRMETNRALSNNDLVNSIEEIDIQKLGDNSIEVFVLYNETETINGVIN